jgi:hypothetical protein
MKNLVTSSTSSVFTRRFDYFLDVVDGDPNFGGAIL